tara:strand:- start:109 stop:339 length:231 start_codon:yes stop_codon:yes gene_type:complete
MRHIIAVRVFLLYLVVTLELPELQDHKGLLDLKETLDHKGLQETLELQDRKELPVHRELPDRRAMLLNTLTLLHRN